MVTNSSVGVVSGRNPALNVGLTTDELQVTRTLRVAVSNTVLSTGLVVRVLGDTTVGVHGHKVEGTIQTAREVGNIDGEGELLVQQVKNLVVGVICHEVGTRSDVGTGNEVQTQRIAGGSDTVRSRVVCTVESTVLSTSSISVADSGIPSVSSIAVGAGIDTMHPAPVGIQYDGARVCGAATT